MDIIDIISLQRWQLMLCTAPVNNSARTGVPTEGEFQQGGISVFKREFQPQTKTQSLKLLVYWPFSRFSWSNSYHCL